MKATRLCNLRCTYCHDWRAGPGQTMGFDVLARTVAAALRDPSHDRVSFLWHGGEPSVLPLDFFRRALVVQARYARAGQRVRNILQTNGTRVTEEWALFLRDHEFQVGISIDGPPELHDRRRVHRSGRGSFDEVLRGMATLRAHDVPFGVLVVVDDDVLALGPDAVFDFMLAHGIRSYGFNAVCPDNQPDAPPGTPAAPYVTPARMSAFLAGLHDRWLRHGDPGIRIRELDGIRARVDGAEAGPCQLRGDCLGDYFIVEPDGEVAHCDLFLGDPAYRLGNVRDATFAMMRTGEAMAALRRKRAAELTAMAGCPEFGVCNGWCPHETYLSQRHDPQHRSDCCGLDGLIRHVRQAGTLRPPPVALPRPMVRAGA